MEFRRGSRMRSHNTHAAAEWSANRSVGKPDPSHGSTGPVVNSSLPLTRQLLDVLSNISAIGASDFQQHVSSLPAMAQLSYLKENTLKSDWQALSRRRVFGCFRARR